MEYVLEHLDAVESTNTYLKQQADPDNGKASVVLTEYQSAGRGAGTNSWESEHGSNILLSIKVFPKSLPAGRMFALSETASIALWRTLSEYTDGISIKWPNDIYLHDGKMAGMLIENDLLGSNVRKAIIGIGLNVNQTIFKSDAPNPVSLAQALGREIERNEVLDRFLAEFAMLYDMMEQGMYDALHKEYMQRLYRRNGSHKYADAEGTFMARIFDIENTGHLILETDGKERRRYDFKEVRFVLQ